MKWLISAETKISAKSSHQDQVPIFRNWKRNLIGPTWKIVPYWWERNY